MNDKRDWTALIITVCAVITAMPRWIGALLASEGFVVPEDWRAWWIVASAVFSAAMAITEGAAFAYVFNAWRVQKDKSADKLLWFAGISGVTFVVVLAPFIAAQVRSKTLAGMLSADWALWVWSCAVAASTIVIVASVGYAQKRTSGAPVRPERSTTKQEIAEVPASQTQELAKASYKCADCGREYATVQALSAHKRFCFRMRNIDAGRPGIEGILPIKTTNGKGPAN